MGGCFHAYDPNQQLLLPPSLRDWLPEGHLCHFVSDTVDQLDIRGILEKYRDGGKGELAYHPRLLLKILIYSYATGVFASRRIAAQVHENVALRILSAGQFPSHRTICRFLSSRTRSMVPTFEEMSFPKSSSAERIASG